MAQILKLGKSPRAISTRAKQYKALGDETRLELMMALASKDESICMCDLTPLSGLAASTVSHHLKLLVDAGLVEREQKGRCAHFLLTPVAQQLLI